MTDQGVQQWEYEAFVSILDWTSGGGVKSDLKLMGSQGWELVIIKTFCFIFDTYYFKRPKQ
jgi:hypothetical protein